MKKLTMEQIKSLDTNTKVIVVDMRTGKSMGQYRVVNKNFMACQFIKEDKFECLSKGEMVFLNEDVDILTYWFVRLNVLEVYKVPENIEDKKTKFYNELVAVLKENIQYVHPELQEHIEVLSDGITNALFIVVGESGGRNCDSRFDLFGVVEGLIIEHSLDTKEWKIYFETEKEISYNEAMEYLTNTDVKFRVESAIMDDLIDTAIEYEDECSMSDEDLDSLDDFLNAFLKEDYSSMMNIIKFISFYGQPEDMQELIENGRWFMEK